MPANLGSVEGDTLVATRQASLLLDARSGRRGARPIPSSDQRRRTLFRPIDAHVDAALMLPPANPGSTRRDRINTG
jgi:hypothetical protein